MLGARAVLQPGATLVDPAEEQRRRRERGNQFQHLGEDLDRLHQHERQEHDERDEAVEQIGGDAPLLQPREGIGDALHEAFRAARIGAARCRSATIDAIARCAVEG